MSDKEPELRIDLDASYIPNRGTPTMNPEMRSDAVIEQDGAQQWKLEAERLAELIEAQQQVIATLREHMKDNNECSSRLRASTEHYAQVCARYQEEIAMLREDNARLTRHHPRRIAVNAIAR